MGGTYCASDGFIRPLQILAGYRAAAERLGARFVWEAAVAGLRRGRGGRIDAVRTARDEIAAEHVVTRRAPGPARSRGWRAWSCRSRRCAAKSPSPCRPPRCPR